MARAPSQPSRTGPLRFILVCFIVSGLIRLGIAGPAIAEQYAALASDVVGPDHSDTGASSSDAAGCRPSGDADELMQAIAGRAQNLDERETYVNAREAALAVAETRIAEQMQALEAAEGRLSATLSRAESAADEDVARLTAVYERMKPEAAAAIFETMDVNFAAGFLARMQPEYAAGILSAMPANVAYSVTVVIAGRNAAAPRN